MGRVSRDARLLFVELWTICDDYGRARAPSRMLASLLFPYDDDAPGLIDGWLAELEREHCIVRYTLDGSTYLQVTNWTTHQRIDKPSKPQFPEPPNTREHSRALASPREPAESAPDDPREGSSMEGNGREGKGKEESDAREKNQTPAGQTILRLKKIGLIGNSMNAQLLDLLARGVTPQQFEESAIELRDRGDPSIFKFGYLMRMVQGRLDDAANRGKGRAAAQAFARTEQQNFEPGALSTGTSPSWMAGDTPHAV